MMSAREHAEAVVAYVDPPPPADPVRAVEEAVRVARAASHERRLEPPVARAFQAYDDALAAMIDLVRVRDREAAELRKRVARIEGATFGDP